MTHRWLGEAVACLICLVGMGCPMNVSAQASPELSLDWDGTVPCERGEPVLERIHALIGEQQAPAADALQVRARANQQDDGTWVLTLRFEGSRAQGTRTLRTDSCSAARRVASLLIALVIDPELLQQNRSASKPAPVEQPLAASESQVRAERSAPPIDAAAPQMRWSAGASVVLVAGVLPQIGYGPAAHASFGAFGFRARLQAAYLLPRATDVATGTAAGARFDLLAGSIQLMRLFDLGVLRLGPYAGFQIGRLHARATGVAEARDAGSLWLAMEAGISSFLELTSWLALRGDAGIDMALRRAHFVVGGLGEVHRADAVSGRITLGLAFALH